MANVLCTVKHPESQTSQKIPGR